MPAGHHLSSSCSTRAQIPYMYFCLDLICWMLMYQMQLECCVFVSGCLAKVFEALVSGLCPKRQGVPQPQRCERRASRITRGVFFSIYSEFLVHTVNRFQITISQTPSQSVLWMVFESRQNNSVLIRKFRACYIMGFAMICYVMY